MTSEKLSPKMLKMLEQKREKARKSSESGRITFDCQNLHYKGEGSDTVYCIKGHKLGLAVEDGTLPETIVLKGFCAYACDKCTDYKE